jgi:hypothetical protein
MTGLEGVSGGIILETGTSRPGTSGSIHCDEEDRAAGQFTLGAITLPSHLPHTTEKASEKRVKGGKEYHRLAMMPGAVRVPPICAFNATPTPPADINVTKGTRKGYAKRHRLVLRDKTKGISKPTIRLLARRGGVKRIPGLIYDLQPVKPVKEPTLKKKRKQARTQPKEPTITKKRLHNPDGDGKESPVIIGEEINVEWDGPAKGKIVSAYRSRDRRNLGWFNIEFEDEVSEWFMVMVRVKVGV